MLLSWNVVLHPNATTTPLPLETCASTGSLAGVACSLVNASSSMSPFDVCTIVPP